ATSAVTGRHSNQLNYRSLFGWGCKNRREFYSHQNKISYPEIFIKTRKNAGNAIRSLGKDYSKQRTPNKEVMGNAAPVIPASFTNCLRLSCFSDIMLTYFI